MIEIDGSYGEGGGQLLRTAVALAALTGQPLALRNIRARRSPPGLAPQHMTAVRAVATLCAAGVEGLEARSQELTFTPDGLRSGRFAFDVGTAGSVTLVLQAVLPVATMCGGAVHARLTGGTDVKAAPSLDYLRYVFLPLLARLGVNAEIVLRRRGYYPRGGGEIEAVVQPGRPRALRLETAGPLESIHGAAHVANLPAHIVARMANTAVALLPGFPPARIEQQMLGRSDAVGQGGAIVVWARTAHTILGGSEVAQRGIPAERIAQNAVNALREELVAGATLDIHAADQVLIYLALADGPSHFLARSVSSHARTTMWLLRQFLPVQFRETAAGSCTRLDVVPQGTGESSDG